MLACGPGSCILSLTSWETLGKSPRILACFPINKEGTVIVPALPPLRGQLAMTSHRLSGSFPGSPASCSGLLGRGLPGSRRNNICWAL